MEDSLVPPASPQSAGTSLAEFVIVLACAVTLLAFSAPNIMRFRQDWMLWGGAHLLESSLQWGRMHAISSNSSLEFVVDEDGRRFYWADPLTGEAIESTVRWLPGWVRIVGSPRRPLRYYPHGNAAPAATYILQGEAGFYRVVVNIAGRIRVRKG